MLQQGNATMGQAIGAYAQQASAQAVPKELGLLQRMEGVAGGVDEIHRRLRELCARVAGVPSGEQGAPSQPVGMPATLSFCEERIRETIALLNGMERAF